MAGAFESAGKAPPGPKTPLTPYQKKLLFFLSVATFFEGYDFIALSQLLPEIRGSYGLALGDGQSLVSLINVGTILAYFLVRLGDRWGRRPILSVTIIGYTLCSFVSGFAPNAAIFAAAQLLARLFLIGEWSISMVYASEEFPADRRGVALGLIQGFASLGSITCVALIPMLKKIDLFGWGPSEGWRYVYFAGGLPLVLVAFLRRSLKESSRFEQIKATAQATPMRDFLLSFARIMKTPYRNRVLLLSVIWFLSYLCMANALVSWKEFMLEERISILSTATDPLLLQEQAGKKISQALTFASLFALPLVFLVGKLLDVAGRRRGSVVVYLVSVIGVFLSYTLSSYWPLVAGITLGIFAVSAFLSVLNTYNTELFPTELRADAFAWSNNFLGRLGTIAGPLLVGALLPSLGIGWAVASTCLFPLAAMVLIVVFLPETKDKELDEISAG